MAPPPKDRRAAVIESATLNGIDFVEVASADQMTLRVHFLNNVTVQGTLTSPPTITGGETIRAVKVMPLDEPNDWKADVDGQPMLTLRVAAPGDFSDYTLTLSSPSLDPFFESVKFSFKALCESTLDCEPPPEECPPEEDAAPPIDYLAKDFLSFRKALSDFSALRYPEWAERSEADFGVMFMEALCAVADDLSYTQDRVAAEAMLEMATERRSVVRLARLVDYEPRPATAATALLQFNVQAGSPPLAPGLVVSAQGPDGARIEFETGTGLRDRSSYHVSDAWNNDRIKPYYWDDSQRCLRRGSTEMWVEGHGFAFTEGQTLLVETDAEVEADPPLRETVRLVEAVEETDPLFGTQVTRIRWRPEDALRYDRDISLGASGNSRTRLAGNLVPATQGRRFVESFAVETAPPSSPQMELAVTRTGANGSQLYLYTMRHAPLAWLAQEGEASAAGPRPPLPEILLAQQAATPIDWPWLRSALDAEASQRAFTLEPSRYARVAINSDLTASHEYDGDGGDTVRFGDGVFGEMPEPGTAFRVTYRSGGGASGNVAPDSVTKFDPLAAPTTMSVTNPFPATGGADEEPDERVRRLAPQAFRARQFRAVRAEDYEEMAMRLPWVSNAGTVFRWTGSWLTVFTTVDPQGTTEIPTNRHIELIDLLNRVRLAGYESYAPAPRFAPLDLVVKVCARPDAYRGDVEAAVLEALSARRFLDGRTGFFHPDRFTFGTPLERSSLEAMIQDAYGVAGVTSVRYRQRGFTPGYVEMSEFVKIRPDEILRVENNPSRPERGSIKVIVEGGK